MTDTLFSVSVPVLSAHKISILPKFWMETSRFTMTPFLDMEAAPRARLIDRIIGNNSGVSPTARATANRRDSRIPRLKLALMKNTRITRTKVTCIIRMPNLLSPPSNSVSGFFSVSFPAICPNCVALPVLTMTAVAVPLVMDVPIKR